MVLKKTDKIIVTALRYPPNHGGVEYVCEQHVGFLKSAGYDLVVVTMNARQKKRKLETLGRHGEKIVSYRPFLTIASVPLSWGYVFEHLSLAKKLGPEALFAVHYPSPLDTLLALISNFLFRSRYFLTVHSVVTNKPWLFVKLSELWEERSFKKSELVLFTSLRLKRLFVPNFCTDYKSWVVPIGINLDESGTPNIESTEKSREGDSSLRLLFLGRFVPYKGLVYLLEALRGLEGVTLDLFGDGRLKRSLENFAAEASLSENVFFHENLSDAKKMDLLARSDVLVLPSINSGEAFGIVQLEAMAKGLAVINTYLATGTSEVSRHQLSGLSVRASDAKQLRAAICKLRDDSLLLKRLQQGALDRSRDFDLKIINRIFLDAVHGQN